MELYCNNEKKPRIYFWGSAIKVEEYNTLGWLQDVNYIDKNSLNEQIFHGIKIRMYITILQINCQNIIFKSKKYF